MMIPKLFVPVACLLFLSSVVPLYAGTPAQSDLSVMKSGPTEAAANSDVTYTIEVDNFGPDAAGGAQLKDAVPAGMTFVSFAQTAGPTWTCNTPGVGAGGNVTCNIASLSAGSTSTFTFVGHIPQGTPPGTFITNIATVSRQSDSDCRARAWTIVDAVRLKQCPRRSYAGITRREWRSVDSERRLAERSCFGGAAGSEWPGIAES